MTSKSVTMFKLFTTVFPFEDSTANIIVDLLVNTFLRYVTVISQSSIFFNLEFFMPCSTFKIIGTEIQSLYCLPTDCYGPTVFVYSLKGYMDSDNMMINIPFNSTESNNCNLALEAY